MTETMYGADCSTYHRLIVSKLNLRIQSARRPKGKKTPKRRDVSKLNQNIMRQAFINDICRHFGAMDPSSEDPTEIWTVLQNVLHSSAATTLGHLSSNYQDWIDEDDEEIKRLVGGNRRLYKAHQYL